jgi:CBS domain-containing protein
MRLQDIMSRDIKTVGSGASAIEARNAMRISRVRHLLVIGGRDVVEPPPCASRLTITS